MPSTASSGESDNGKRRPGRPNKSAGEYGGTPEQVEIALATNELRRRRRHEKALTPNSGSGRRGAPIKRHTPRHEARRDSYATKQQRTLLEEMCKPLGIDPDHSFEKIINNVSQTRKGKTLLPNVAAQTKTTKAMATMLATHARNSAKQGFVRSLSDCHEVRPADLSIALDINVGSIKKYKQRRNKNAEAAAALLLKKTREGVRRNKIIPGESEATIQHAKGRMYAKSGAGSDVFILPSQIKQLYVHYRANYYSIVERIQCHLNKTNSEASSRSLTFKNNATLISRGIVEVEPWSEHVASLKLWVGHRKAAGLSTVACLNLVVNDGGKMVVIDVGSIERADNNDSSSTPPVDYATVPTQLEDQLKRSRTKNDQLRPRNYKTWKAIITDNEDFRWRQMLQPYSCDVCTAAPGVERQWETAQRAFYDAVPKTPQQSLAISSMYWAYQDMSDLEQHKMQLAHQRVYLQEQEKALPPKSKDVFKVIVYVDFVAQYNYKKKKVANLVFTIKWRDENNQLQYKYLDNFCSDKTQKADAMYVQSAWTFHMRTNYLRHQLRATGVLSPETKQTYTEELEAIRLTRKRDEFAGVTHIIRTGDNGGHLLNRVVMNWESCVHTDYGIVFETHTLPKRHGYSLCDAHGGAVKRTINAFGVAHYDPENAHDFANIINGWVCGPFLEGEAKHAQCTAYAMQNISRITKADLYEASRTCHGIQKASEFLYTCLDEEGKEVHIPGVVRVKEVSGCKEEECIVFDIVKRDKAEYGVICNGCTRRQQHPVYHRKSIFSGRSTYPCTFKTSKGAEVPFRRPGLYPPVTSSTFMKVPCVVSVLQARTVPDVIKLGRRPKRDNGNEEAGAVAPLNTLFQ